MELYLFVVVVLFALAISDLIVGVSNDAVNFLNSSIGSKVATRRTIMIIASIGMLFGVMFSSGMMEVARKGIFHPQEFIMPELLVIYLAVMITDVILLDLYNTFGLPTSTTVSIVFELLGAAVAVSWIKLAQAGEAVSAMSKYINSDKALAIISGILLSVVIAFTVGAIVQYFVRLVFTFDFKNKIKKYGSIWGGIALTAITYFILIKGAKGAVFLTEDVVMWIRTNTGLILLGSFLFWAVIMQLLSWLVKVNILKIIVLVGTGALAMAFAANDLVNFIGVPLAGFHAFLMAADNPVNPLTTSMAGMAGKVKTETWMLLVAGFIMVVTLWFSKKARSVTKTEVGLGRQDSDHDERFQATGFSRTVVRFAVGVSDFFQKITPISMQQKLDDRFDESKSPLNAIAVDDRPAFDMLRASVNLVVASILISFATSLKLPLSTTYVTFMVAMGSSLSDRAWGLESAVYRITGVFTVIGGWFLTAVSAFTVSCIFAALIYYFRLPATIILVLLAAYMVYNTHLLHKKRDREEYHVEEDDEASEDPLTVYFVKIQKYYTKIAHNIKISIEGLVKQDRKMLRDNRDDASSIKDRGGKLVNQMMTILRDPSFQSQTSPRAFGAIRAASRHTSELAFMTYNHIANKHKGLTDDQVKDIEKAKNAVIDYISLDKDVLNSDYLNKKIEQGFDLKDTLNQISKNQIKRIKKGESKTRISMLFLNIISHFDELVDDYIELLKSYRLNQE